MVYEPEACRPDGVHRVAADHQVQGRDHAAEPRRALGAPRTGQQAEFHFRQADPGVRKRAAVVAAQRDLEAATERGAMQGGHHELPGIFDLVA